MVYKSCVYPEICPKLREKFHEELKDVCKNNELM